MKITLIILVLALLFSAGCDGLKNVNGAQRKELAEQEG